MDSKLSSCLQKPALAPAAAEALALVATLRTHDLFGASREVRIDHGGELYRLRITRAGKLILTK